ncbi:TrmH family RNA methyltransferase [Intestinibacter sp.]|uniref:TrmH family RNA methyltransferase n=1 Tax=Intestinibacter sp. TaxID=1965304 RepID=UPI002A91EB09|nr:RNA methyltransferase [Intestinibacter sp.]MDY5212877.1 RNA methyltransferase [Intestinibacter sp.]
MINIIKSKDNDKIKYTKSLLKTKGRNKEKKFIIEGYRILTLALECDAKLEYVFINEDFEKKQEHKVLLEELQNKGIKIYKTLNKIFLEMVDTENTQGILAVLEYKERDLVNNISQDDKFVLILDRIQDPGNMGTIIRTADSAGVDSVILLKGCVDIYNPKVIRSTMGSIFDMNVIHATQDEAVEFLKSNDFNIVSSYLQTENYYHETTYDGKIALVIGNEANGINDKLIEQSDKLVKIPIYGNAESLNAAISAAVLMYEIKKYLA